MICALPGYKVIQATQQATTTFNFTRWTVSALAQDITVDTLDLDLAERAGVRRLLAADGDADPALATVCTDITAEAGAGQEPPPAPATYVCRLQHLHAEWCRLELPQSLCLCTEQQPAHMGPFAEGRIAHLPLSLPLG